VLRFPATYEYVDLDTELSGMRAFYRTMIVERPQERCALIVDLSLVQRSEARNRKHIADEMDALAGPMKMRCVAQAYVVERPIIRAALTAVMWLRAAPWPVQVFGSARDAVNWSRALLANERSRRSAQARV
jgi:hypothetical protein